MTTIESYIESLENYYSHKDFIDFLKNLKDYIDITIKKNEQKQLEYEIEQEIYQLIDEEKTTTQNFTPNVNSNFNSKVNQSSRSHYKNFSKKIYKCFHGVFCEYKNTCQHIHPGQPNYDDAIMFKSTKSCNYDQLPRYQQYFQKQKDNHLNGFIDQNGVYCPYLHCLNCDNLKGFCVAFCNHCKGHCTQSSKNCISFPLSKTTSL